MELRFYLVVDKFVSEVIAYWGSFDVIKLFEKIISTRGDVSGSVQ